MISSFFIKRPYLAIVIAILITLCGALALFTLPIAQYPNITPPQVQISTSYPGADALTVLQTVVEPIEQQVNGVRDMIYLSSTSANSGDASITATFAIGSDGERNTQNVQSRVNWAMSQLPELVQREGVIVKESSGNMLLVLSLYSPGESYDSLFLSNYATINIVNELNRIHGVANLVIFGGADYAMRIWLSPEKLAGLRLTVADVGAAIQAQNIQVSSGSVGGSPALPGQLFQYTVQTLGRLSTVEEFANIVLKTTPDGAQIKMKDVGTLELGAQTYNTTSTLNGKNAILIGLYQLNDANALKISADCRAALAHLSKNFPPDLEYGFQYDTTNFIRASIQEVVATLLIAVGLVVLVSYLFLQNWRMTLVPSLAIPVSIVGTFAVLALLGFSINLVTLFALILAIGIVVDDAIIVIENVSRLMSEEHLTPAQAAEKSMLQMSGAIIATTAVLLSMFVPICFLPGITGELYRQFGVTISTAVAFSAFNALSLTPVLSALLLKPKAAIQKEWFFFRWFNSGFNLLTRFYGRCVHLLIQLAALSVTLFLALALFSGWLYEQTPTGFIPTEDQGVIFANIQLPEATALERTEKIAAAVGAIMQELPGVSDVILSPGYNILVGTPASNCAMMVVILEPWGERDPEGRSADKLIQEAMGRFALFPEAEVMLFEPPPIPGISMTGGFDFELEETSGTDPILLAKSLDNLLDKARTRPELTNVFSTFSATTPYLYLNIDREKALALGVSLTGLNQTLEGLLGSSYINDFNRFGQVYQVQIQSTAQYRNWADKIKEYHVANAAGGMVPLATLVTSSIRLAPQYLARYNLFLSAQIQGRPAAGYSMGTAMQAMTEVAEETLDANQSYNWTGMSYQEEKAGSQVLVVFALAIVFIYLFLAALYSSWLLPLAVIFSIPFALLGALALLWSCGISNNFYAQVGFVLLFAMACKTAVLIVNYARDQRLGGMSVKQSAEYAAKLRFRAVLMTAFAFIFGTLPLAVATGAGAISRRSLGTTVVGGMILAVVGGLLFVPLFYAVLQGVLERGSKTRNSPESDKTNTGN